MKRGAKLGRRPNVIRGRMVVCMMADSAHGDCPGRPRRGNIRCGDCAAAGKKMRVETICNHADRVRVDVDPCA
jgi:hypothetical protein